MLYSSARARAAAPLGPRQRSVPAPIILRLVNDRTDVPLTFRGGGDAARWLNVGRRPFGRRRHENRSSVAAPPLAHTRPDRSNRTTTPPLRIAAHRRASPTLMVLLLFTVLADVVPCPAWCAAFGESPPKSRMLWWLPEVRRAFPQFLRPDVSPPAFMPALSSSPTTASPHPMSRRESVAFP